MARRLAQDTHRVAAALVHLVAGNPDEIRVGGIVFDQRLGDFGFGEKLVAGETRDRFAKGRA